VEFTLDGVQYRTKKLDARRAFHVSRRVAPVIMQADVLLVLKEAVDSKLSGALAMAQAAGPIVKHLAELSEADCDYVLDACLAAVYRLDKTVWQPLWNAQANRMMYEDLSMPQLLQITYQVLQENLGDFFTAAPLTTGPSTSLP